MNLKFKKEQKVNILLIPHLHIKKVTISHKLRKITATFSTDTKMNAKPNKKSKIFLI